jgi:DNA repair exonuclease SbcCD ATPase subunit
MATMKMNRYKSPRLLVVLLLLISLSTAIDLAKAFGGKRNKDPKPAEAVDDADAAITNAKKLVDGTNSSREAGREKESATCNDAMAKALVEANEEKAAVVEERDSIAKAASLLSERIDDLEKQLEEAKNTIDSLKDENVAQQQVANAIEKEREQSKLNMEKLHNSTEAEIESIKEDCRNQVAAVENDRIQQVSVAEKEVERLKEERIAIVEDAEKRAKEAEFAKDEAAHVMKRAMEEADEKVATILADVKNNKEAIMLKAEESVNTLKQQIQQQAQRFEQEISDIKAKNVADIKQAHERVKQAQHKLDEAVALAEKNINAEKDEVAKVKGMLKEAMKDSYAREKALTLELEKTKSSTSDMQNVSVISSASLNVILKYI